jgi:hypothetical protein
MSGLTGGFQRLYAAVQRLAIAFTAAVGPAFADLIDVSVFALETLGMLAKTFPVLVGRVVMATASLTALGVATILGGFAMGVMARGLGVLTGLAVAAMQPFVLLGRAMVFLSLSALQAGTAVGAAFARVAVAIATSVVASLPAVAALAGQMALAGAAAAGMLARGVAFATVSIAAMAQAVALAAASAMPAMLGAIGVVSSELLVLARYARFVLHTWTLGLSTMAGRAAVHLAAIAAGFVSTGVYAVASVVQMVAAAGSVSGVAALVGRSLLGLAANAVSAFAGVASAAAAALPRMLALLGISAAELAVTARYMQFALHKITLGLSTMVGRAVVSLATLAGSFAMTGIAALISMSPAIAVLGAIALATAACVGIGYLLGEALVSVGSSIVAAFSAAYGSVVQFATGVLAAGQDIAQAGQRAALAWAEQFRWMYEQLKSQNFSAIWQAMQLDFQIAMLIMGKHATTAAMFIRGAFDAAASYVSDSMSHALDHIGAMITRLMQQLRLFADYAKLTLLAVMQAAGLISQETLNAAIDAANEAFAAAEENIAAARQGADERRAARQQAADARQAEMDAESERFDQEIEQLRSDLADLMKPVEKKDEPPAGPSSVEPTEFREPAGGIGEAGGDDGIGQTQGTFGSSDGLGVGPELNTLRDHAAVAAAKSVEIADNTKRAGDLLGMIADGRLGGLDAAAGLQPALADSAGSPVLAASTQARMPQLAADSQAGLAQAAQTVQLRVAITTGLDAVAAAVRENTAVTSGQGAQLGSIAAAINTLRGTLV